MGCVLHPGLYLVFSEIVIVPQVHIQKAFFQLKTRFICITFPLAIIEVTATEPKRNAALHI